MRLRRDELASRFELLEMAPHAAGHRPSSDDDAQLLHLEAATGLPDHVRQLVAKIPFGKGMAGICWERREPVTVCNLQTDDSGVVRPGAKDTKVAGALVVPVFQGDAIRATLGIGKAEDHDYTDDEIAHLRSCGEILLDLL